MLPVPMGAEDHRTPAPTCVRRCADTGVRVRQRDVLREEIPRLLEDLGGLSGHPRRPGQAGGCACGVPELNHQLPNRPCSDPGVPAAAVAEMQRHGAEGMGTARSRKDEPYGRLDINRRPTGRRCDGGGAKGGGHGESRGERGTRGHHPPPADSGGPAGPEGAARWEQGRTLQGDLLRGWCARCAGTWCPTGRLGTALSANYSDSSSVSLTFVTHRRRTGEFGHARSGGQAGWPPRMPLVADRRRSGAFGCREADPAQPNRLKRLCAGTVRRCPAGFRG